MAQKYKFTWIKSKNNSSIVEATLYPTPDIIYLLNEPGCFNDWLHNIKYEKNDINDARHIIYTLIDELNFIKNRDILDNAYKALKNAKDLNDILLALSNIKIIYQINLPELTANHRFTLTEKNLSKLEEIKNRNPRLVASLAAKKIIQIYCYNKINDFNFTKIEELYNLANEFINNEIIYEEAGFVFDDIDFNNISDATKPEIIPAIRNVFIDRVQHLCINCKNASPDKCEKIFDSCENKKNIKEYDFIISGYQTYIDKQMDRFLVTECKNYEPDDETIKTSLIETKKLRNNLKTLYFDTATVKEANELQKQLIKRGELKFTSGYGISKDINKIKK